MIPPRCVSSGVTLRNLVVGECPVGAGGLTKPASRSGVICTEIHMSDSPSSSYTYSCGERGIQSVVNLARRDGREFLSLAAELGIHPCSSTIGAVDPGTSATDRACEVDCGVSHRDSTLSAAVSRQAPI